jgi:hypothetical protein
MKPLPKISGTPIDWKRRAETKERSKESASFERRCQVLAMARQIRSEIRAERQQRKSV